MRLLWNHCGNFLLNPTLPQYCMHGHSLITAIVSKVSTQNNTHFLFESDLQITELFSLEDAFDGLRTASKVGEATQSIQAQSENGVCTVDSEQSTLLITDNGCENSPAVDNPSESSQPVPSSGQQSTLSLSRTVTALAQPTFRFTFTFPSSTSSSRPTGQNLKGGRCSVCTKALCPRRHECNGSVNRAWCGHGHPPLGANEKIRWSEAEVERRIATASSMT